MKRELFSRYAIVRQRISCKKWPEEAADFMSVVLQFQPNAPALQGMVDQSCFAQT